jgi:predicted acetyltransferase
VEDTDAPELRPPTAEEFPAFVRDLEAAFGEDVSDDDVERFRSVAELDRFLGLFAADGGVVGTAGAYTFDLSVPGAPPAPCAGVTVVSVRADHRRRGFLSRMMAALLDEADARGEPFAALWASESGIYGRYGFGPAIPTARLEVARDRSAFRADVEADTGSVELVGVGEALEACPPVREAVRVQRPGMLSRPEAWWRRWLEHDPKEGREGAGPRRHAVVPGRGYAIHRLKPAWDHVVPDGTVVVEELVATDPAAHAALWRFLLDTDLSVRTRATGRPVDDVLPLLVAEPAHVRVTADEPVYLRLVDLPAALTARRYAGSDRLVIEVRDAFRPRNAGRWSLGVVDGAATCERVEAAADLVLDTAELATVLLGGVRTTRLAAAGLVDAPVPDAAARLDRLVATDLAPWHTGMF